MTMLKKNINQSKQKNNVRGFIVGYLIFSLALLSVLVGAISRFSNSNSDAKRTASIQDELLVQIELIRAKINACVINYPAGDNGLGFRSAYPEVPVSGLVSDLTCPGATVGSSTLWSGNDGLFSPRVIPGLSAWQYEHTATVLSISISPSDSDGVVNAALRSITLRYGAQGAFIIAPNITARISLVN